MKELSRDKLVDCLVVKPFCGHKTGAVIRLNEFDADEHTRLKYVKPASESDVKKQAAKAKAPKAAEQPNAASEGE